jgi:hypothetical protein
MLPEHRLETLVEQALEFQMQQCLHNNTQQVAVSLLSDYKCGAEQIPMRTVQVRLGVC